MPQQHVQPRLDLRLMHDRHVDGQIPRAPERPVQKLPVDLGIGGNPLGEVEVEQCKAAMPQYPPAQSPGNRGTEVLSMPRAQQVSPREQLAAEPPVEVDMSE